jgi:acyl-coenzyme A thioesterase PaaI-like protein
MGFTYSAWRRLSGLPGGRTAFTQAVCLRVPYFGSIHPHVQELRPGYCEVRAPNRRGVHNHLGTFHAIAMCNMAELAMGMLAEATVPDTHRWIPIGMTVEYLAKAKTDLRAFARLDPVRSFESLSDVPVTVSIVDRDDKEVSRATITIRVEPKS